jgi:hypothetical protein
LFKRAAASHIGGGELIEREDSFTIDCTGFSNLDLRLHVIHNGLLRGLHAEQEVTALQAAEQYRH